MINPRGARVLVKRIEQARPESQRIIIPETVADKPSQFGIVLAFGKLAEGGIEVGDLVVLKDFVGSIIFTKIDPADEDESECTIVNEEDILAVVTEV